MAEPRTSPAPPATPDLGEGAQRPYRTKLYRNGASQAVRIPKALAFDEDCEVELVRRGDEVIVRPVRRTMEGFAEALACLRGMERVPFVDAERGW